ncbi:hypothetical protein [Streptomyces sp. NPDC012888]|uniref:hypothetical protein n=1 Tax=Streptomyces sp. NPDC012888 TaxID=3364855 RepID=UPI003692D7AB
MPRPRVVCVLDWHGEPPYGLTAVGVAADRLAAAEALASAALAGLVPPPTWEGADPALRKRVVRACRPIPTEGLWHVSDDRPAVPPDRSHEDCLHQLATEWPHAALPPTPPAHPSPGGPAVPGESALPGLTALARLTALVCRMPPGVDLAAEEDLLDIYDTYTVGGLTPPP